MALQHPDNKPAAEAEAGAASPRGVDAGRCATVLIPDNPSVEDKFGTHGRVAQAIAELIGSGADGVSVGVEGSWGSGKTTVSRLLEAHFSEKRDYAVVTFDAWAHEGDPLRLIFLQSILQDLEASDWIEAGKREYWKEKLEEIANRRQTEIKKDYPSLSGVGKAFSLALLLVPLSAAFANAALRDDRLTLLGGSLSLRFLALFAVALALAVAPLLILLYMWLRMSKEERKKYSAWSLVFTKGVTENRTETLKTANPTSIEFEKVFEELMGEALGNSPKSGRRLVLVIDNLDRVDSEVALAIWSTLQTFLKHRSASGAKGAKKFEWAKRLWVVALYDPRGLSLIWEKALPGESAGQGQTPAADAPQGAAKDEQAGAAQSFMDKSFQVRFEVAAPVLSNWRDFLIGLLWDALPGHRVRQPGPDGRPSPDEPVEEDFHAVYRVMAIHLNRRRLLPTIRELKLFVNQIGAVHRQWAADPGAKPPRPDDLFPLSHMAYYALLRRRGREVVRGLLGTDPGEKLPEPEYADLLGADIADNLAAMAFNVEVKLARQLLISPELKSALGRGEPEPPAEGAQSEQPAETLKRLADAHPKGFWEVLEETVREEWTSDEAPKIAYAAYNLEQSGLLENTARPEVRNVAASLFIQAGRMASWPLSDERMARGLSSILRWRKSMARGPADAGQYVATLMRAVAAGFENVSDVQKWSALTKILRDELGAGDIEKAFDPVLAEILVEPLRREDHRPPSEIIATRLEALTELSAHNTFAETRLSSLVTEDRLLLLWARASESSPSGAWVLFTSLRIKPGLGVPPDAVDDVKRSRESMMNALREPVSNMVDEFTALVRRYRRLDLLFDVQKELPDAAAFVRFCLMRVLEGEDAPTILPPLELYFKWQDIDAALRKVPDAEAALEAYLKRTNLADVLSGYAFDIRAAGLYRRILASGGSSHSGFMQWLVAGLNDVDAEHWQQELAKDGELLKIALEVHKDRNEGWLGESFKAAMVAHAAAVLRGKSDASPLFGSFSPAELLVPSLREGLRSKLYSKLAKSPMKSATPAFFAVYGEEVLNAAELRSAENSYKDLFIPLLHRQNPVILGWLAQVFSRHESLRSDERQAEQVEEFRAALREMVAQKPLGNLASLLRSLASMFGPDVKP